MAVDQSGVRWPELPFAGAVGAGRRDVLPDVPAGFGLTPSGQAEQDNAALNISVQSLEDPGQEVSGAGSEQPG
jgi:hypothetical protein